MHFTKTTPESVGISSKQVLDFVKMLDGYHMQTHSILMARGNYLFAECYYAPIHKDFLHRMYSVSKSFVSVAVGLAITEGLIHMDDSILSYFPEFRNENTDEYYEECTVRNMLSMQSNIASSINWWGKFESRVEAYYAQKTGKIPGTLYFYDSIGSFLLGCIVEKLTGKPFLDYLKEKVLLKIGFSKESYTLYEPGGFTVGDSGVMCTAKDLLIFARFIMNKGEWDGVQYIDRDFMEQAISRQVNNDITGGLTSWNTNGYGFLIWKTHDDGFSLIGMGDQLAICDMKRDIVIVITSDNQGDGSARHIIFHELYHHFLSDFSEKALPEDAEAYRALFGYLTQKKLVHQWGAEKTEISDAVNKQVYIADENAFGITEFSLETEQNAGIIRFLKDGQVYKVPFGIGENKEISFSPVNRPKKNAMGFTEEGAYPCCASGAWVDACTFAVKLQVIDTYFGSLQILIGFKDTRATLSMRKSGQYVFENWEGYVIGTTEKENIK